MNNRIRIISFLVSAVIFQTFAYAVTNNTRNKCVTQNQVDAKFFRLVIENRNPSKVCKEIKEIFKKGNFCKDVKQYSIDDLEYSAEILCSKTDADVTPVRDRATAKVKIYGYIKAFSCKFKLQGSKKTKIINAHFGATGKKYSNGETVSLFLTFPNEGVSFLTDANVISIRKNFLHFRSIDSTGTEYEIKVKNTSGTISLPSQTNNGTCSLGESFK